GSLTKSGAGTLELDGSVNLGNATQLTVTGGTLKLATSGGTVGSGGLVVVHSGATLELAGSISALASGTIRAAISNDSTAAAGGLLVSTGDQHVGSVDGVGTTVVNNGAVLRVWRVVQSALMIGGSATSPGSLTIDPSDANGNPLAEFIASTSNE